MLIYLLSLAFYVTSPTCSSESDLPKNYKSRKRLMNSQISFTVCQVQIFQLGILFLNSLPPAKTQSLPLHLPLLFPSYKQFLFCPTFTIFIQTATPKPKGFLLRLVMVPQKIVYNWSSICKLFWWESINSGNLLQTQSKQHRFNSQWTVTRFVCRKFTPWDRNRWSDGQRYCVGRNFVELDSPILVHNNSSIDRRGYKLLVKLQSWWLSRD